MPWVLLGKEETIWKIRLGFIYTNLKGTKAWTKLVMLWTVWRGWGRGIRKSRRSEMRLIPGLLLVWMMISASEVGKRSLLVMIPSAHWDISIRKQFSTYEFLFISTYWVSALCMHCYAFVERAVNKADNIFYYWSYILISRER